MLLKGSYVQTPTPLGEEGTMRTQPNAFQGPFSKGLPSGRGGETSDTQGWGPRELHSRSNASQTEHGTVEQFVLHSGAGPQHVGMSASLSDLPAGTELPSEASKGHTIASSIRADGMLR